MAKKQWLPEGFICVHKVKDGYSLELGNPTNMIYNVQTGIIYYYFNDKGQRSMCPYYGKNGKPCTIKKCQIVEVN